MPTPLFKKGHPRLAGRPRGGINRNSKLLKDALLIAGAVTGDRFVMREIIESSKAEALDKDGQRIAGELEELVEEHGPLIGYLSWMAEYHVSAYASLLGRVLPMQIKVDSHKTVVYKSVEEVQREIEKLKLPLDRIMPLLFDVKSTPRTTQDQATIEESTDAVLDDDEGDRGSGDY
jgi:hypothetical protein